MKRNATAVWNGTIKEGKGHLTTDSTVLNQTQYSFNSRFADGVGTNPEELMAAAHAGCFTMKLSLDLTEAGFNPTSLETKATVSLDNGVITSSNLVLKADIPGITETQFQEIAAGAKENCPVSKAYNVAISLEASLV
ncbi:osmotically inducible protein OsmC [Pedobacter cryoconitis]|uniref:Osmotically inducible protein OsmC n=1 Tax=Pedobacter cryoconitis TaxID=188932 RepID=A0A7W9DXI2_9SPHI|nr:OsmC family protein [Pedobacter cryoconitis]MBB5634194.1 osmotically inducible protein OsmC [Pedobacter cryoconitis]MBB6272685.1 osmotically inducible protein OsmC [Pedobacter cryoconitis]